MPDKVENKVVDLVARHRFMRFLRNDVLGKFEPKHNVMVKDNNIYLDGAIVDKDTAEMINGDEDNDWGYPCISPFELRQALEMVSGDINLFINSPGGSVFEGARMVTALEDKISSGANITLIVDGLCASAATYMLVADGLTRRLITKFSQVMIHDAWVGAVGNAKELREIADVLDSTDSEYARLLAGIMDSTEEEVREMMSAESWFTAEAAINIGLIQDYYTSPTAGDGDTDASENGDSSEEMGEGLLSNRLNLLNLETQRTLLGL